PQRRRLGGHQGGDAGRDADSEPDGGAARGHQNELRDKALAMEIVKIPTYVSRRRPRSAVRSMGRSRARNGPGVLKSPSLARPSRPAAAKRSPPYTRPRRRQTGIAYSTRTRPA